MYLWIHSTGSTQCLLYTVHCIFFRTEWFTSNYLYRKIVILSWEWMRSWQEYLFSTETQGLRDGAFYLLPMESLYFQVSGTLNAPRTLSDWVLLTKEESYIEFCWVLLYNSAKATQLISYSPVMFILRPVFIINKINCSIYFWWVPGTQMLIITDHLMKTIWMSPMVNFTLPQIVYVKRFPSQPDLFAFKPICLFLRWLLINFAFILGLTQEF